ncbi:MAG: glycosyltransferase family 39 protein [Anaerolineae bacterium]|nr:glycosyltransferase family 39 protein [Anaerolineae bacterium]
MTVSTSYQSTKTLIIPPKHLGWLVAILLLAVALRLFFILIVTRGAAVPGGDTAWYLEYGYQLVVGTLENPVQPGPVYLIYVGLMQVIFGRADIKIILQVANIAWHLLLMVAIYALGRRYFSERAGLLAALFIAVNPIFIIEAGAILTESMYLGLLFGALWYYAATVESLNWRHALVIGVLFGVASLTRIVLLAFPLLLALHMIIMKRAWRLAALMLIVYALTVSTWTFYNLARWNRFIIGGEGLTAFAYMGATGTTSQYEIDADLGDAAVRNERDPAFIAGVLERLRNLPDYLRTRVGNLAWAVTQPHNTIFYPGESLKELVAKWWATDRSFGGFISVTQGDAFWSKLVLYCFHFFALSLGFIGILRVLIQRRFWLLLPLIGYVAYTLAVHLVLYAHPRYIFPITPILILLAMDTVEAWYSAWDVRRHYTAAIMTVRLDEAK